MIPPKKRRTRRISRAELQNRAEIQELRQKVRQIPPVVEPEKIRMLEEKIKKLPTITPATIIQEARKIPGITPQAIISQLRQVPGISTQQLIKSIREIPGITPATIIQEARKIPGITPQQIRALREKISGLPALTPERIEALRREIQDYSARATRLPAAGIPLEPPGPYYSGMLLKFVLILVAIAIVLAAISSIHLF